MSQLEPRTLPCKLPAGVIIRTALAGDAQSLLDLSRQVMEERHVTLTEWDETSRTVAGEEELIQKAIEHPGDLILVAEVSGIVVGMLDFSTRRKRKVAHSGEFGMSVIQLWRNHGIGRALLTVLIDWASLQPSLEKLDLGVFATNGRAIHLYKSVGFHEEGRRAKGIKFGDGLYDDLVLMSRVVHQDQKS